MVGAALVVLDASFIVKLTINEECSEEATKIYEEFSRSAEDLHVPCIAFSEVLNAVWKHYALLRDIGRDEVEKALRILEALARVLVSHDNTLLLREAFNIASVAKISVYDALYLALAKKLNQPLYTFDKVLWSKTREIKELGKLIVVPRC